MKNPRAFSGTHGFFRKPQQGLDSGDPYLFRNEDSHTDASRRLRLKKYCPVFLFPIILYRGGFCCNKKHGPASKI
jgi:hypothetical protein